MTSAGQIVFFAFCSNRDCRRLLGVNMIGMEAPRVQPAGGRLGGLN
jgi:hypothetical protein